MNKVQRQMKQAQRNGYTPLDVLRMKEIARVEAQKMADEANEQAFLYMLAIPLNVLVSDYWPKSAKKKIPAYIKQVCSLYESVQAGVVTNENLAQFLKDETGIVIEAEWLNCKENKDGKM